MTTEQLSKKVKQCKNLNDFAKLVADNYDMDAPISDLKLIEMANYAGYFFAGLPQKKKLAVS